MKRFRFFEVFAGPFGPFEKDVGLFSDLKIGLQSFFPRFNSEMKNLRRSDSSPVAARIEDDETKESKKFRKKEMQNLISLFRDIEPEIQSFQDLDRFAKMGAWK